MNEAVRAHELRAVPAGTAPVIARPLAPSYVASSHVAPSHVAPLRVERVASRRAGDYAAAWADLAARAIEANVFLDPAFALPLMQHVEASRRPDLLLVWDHADRLLGLCPVSLPRIALIGQARGFSDKQACLGVPLLDRERGCAAFAAMLDWLTRSTPRPATLMLTAVPADGAFMQAVVGELGPAHRVDVLAAYQRAALRAPRAGGNDLAALASAKRRKERKRQRRRLAEHGVRAYVSARTPEAVAQALERFFVLENKGWKGQRGTALRATPALAAFARDMTRRMAEAGRCRIDALEINGQPVAMGIVLTCGNRAYFWKTAFDQEFAPLSPGVQFAADLAEAQLGEVDTASTDSCAIPDHPMIDKLWPDRLPLLDFAIALGSDRPQRLGLSLRLERARRDVRAWAKAHRQRFARRSTSN